MSVGVSHEFLVGGESPILRDVQLLLNVDRYPLLFWDDGSLSRTVGRLGVYNHPLPIGPRSRDFARIGSFARLSGPVGNHRFPDV